MMKLTNYKITLLIGICTIFVGAVTAADNRTLTPPTSVEYNPYSADNNNQFPEEMYQVIIDPLHRTELSAQIQSPVVTIYKHMGDSFTKGEILIQLDDTIYKSNVNKVMAALSKAQVELDGKKQLFKDNVASLFELKEAEANLAAAQADLSLAQRDLNATTIKAPFDGKVVTLNIEEHELPQSGKELIEIVYDKTLLAKLLIPSIMLKSIKIGQPFTIEVNETNKRITANILRIGSVIDPSSSTIKIEAEIDNKDDLLRAGMTGKVSFDSTSAIIPISSKESNSDVNPNINSKK